MVGIKTPALRMLPTAIYAQRQLPHPNVEEHDVGVGHTFVLAMFILRTPFRFHGGAGGRGVPRLRSEWQSDSGSQS